MPRLANLLVRTRQWSALGHNYRLSPLTLADLAEIELRVACQETTAAHEGDTAGGLGTTAPTTAAIARWILDAPGTACALWLSLRTYQPDVSLDQAESLVERLACEAAPLDDQQEPPPAVDAGGRQCGPDWPRLLDHFAARYGWTLEQIAGLTLAQADSLLAAASSATHRVLLTRGEYRQLWCKAPKQCRPSAEQRARSLPRAADRRRLAGFRRELPEIYEPLTALALARLVVSLERLDHRRARRCRPIGRPRRRDVTGLAFDGARGGRGLAGASHKIDALLEALRHQVARGRETGFPDLLATARFQ